MPFRVAAPMLVWLLLWGGTAGANMPAKADPQSPCRAAELFGPDDADAGPTVDAAVAQNGVTLTGSTALDGVFWSNALQRVDSERSRELHVCSPGEPALHAAAEAVRRQFHQQAVLTFDYQPQHAADANAVIITAPNVDFARFREAFETDADAHRRLLGGSVTTDDHTLILVAGNGELDVAGRLVGEAGADWNAAVIGYGRMEFVT